MSFGMRWFTLKLEDLDEDCRQDTKGSDHIVVLRLRCLNDQEGKNAFSNHEETPLAISVDNIIWKNEQKE
jgi:hypothetical protein